MSLLEIRTHSTMIPEKINLAGAQGNNFKIAIMNMPKELKEHVSICLNEV